MNKKREQHTQCFAVSFPSFLQLQVQFMLFYILWADILPAMSNSTYAYFNLDNLAH